MCDIYIIRLNRSRIYICKCESRESRPIQAGGIHIQKSPLPSEVRVLKNGSCRKSSRKRTLPLLSMSVRRSANIHSANFVLEQSSSETRKSVRRTTHTTPPPIPSGRGGDETWSHKTPFSNHASPFLPFDFYASCSIKNVSPEVGTRHTIIFITPH